MGCWFSVIYPLNTWEDDIYIQYLFCTYDNCSSYLMLQHNKLSALKQQLYFAHKSAIWAGLSRDIQPSAGLTWRLGVIIIWSSLPHHLEGWERLKHPHCSGISISLWSLQHDCFRVTRLFPCQLRQYSQSTWPKKENVRWEPYLLWLILGNLHILTPITEAVTKSTQFQWEWK